MTAAELLKTWLKQAKSPTLLHMAPQAVTDFALRNELAVREIRTSNWTLIGWRLYENHLSPDGKTREPDELYFVVEKM